jgi:peptidoglycan/xylan/chitin deacetylase (PgdA/CDA1 family)
MDLCQPYEKGPSLIRHTFEFLRSMDRFLCRSYVRLAPERASLIVVGLHSLLRDQAQSEQQTIDPRMGFTVDQLRCLIEYFMGCGYTFISPNDMERGLDIHRKYLLLTFDDGYYNNYLALPVLRQYQIPATFFISTDYVLHNRSFWWDVVYREMSKQRKTLQDIDRLCRQLKRHPVKEIDRFVRKAFGSSAFDPIGDIDRPFLFDELIEFSRSPWVSIGNHTVHHAILSVCSTQQIKREIQGAQEALSNLTGIVPKMMAYPNGNTSPEIMNECRTLGLTFGVTDKGYKNHLPLEGRSMRSLQLGRFVLTQYQSELRHFETLRSDIQPKKQLKALLCRNG